MFGQTIVDNTSNMSGQIQPACCGWSLSWGRPAQLLTYGLSSIIGHLQAPCLHTLHQSPGHLTHPAEARGDAISSIRFFKLYVNMFYVLFQ